MTKNTKQLTMSLLKPLKEPIASSSGNKKLIQGDSIKKKSSIQNEFKGNFPYINSVIILCSCKEVKF